MGNRNSLLVLPQWWYEGIRGYGKAGYTRSSKNFNDADIADNLDGFQVAVTGANSGIGYACVKGLASRGATVHMLCRSMDRGESAAAKIRMENPNANLHVYCVDVSSSQSVRHFASTFNCIRLDALVNNAGAMLETRVETGEGNEACFAVMAGGTYLLTGLLLDRLIAAHGRVVNVSSAGMYPVKLDLKDLQQHHGGKYDGVYAYAQSKRAQLYLATIWDRLVQGTGVRVFSCHPGWVDTPGIRTGAMEWFYNAKWRPELRTPSEGADTVVWLAAARGVERINDAPVGAFWFDREVKPHHFKWSGTKSTDEEVQKLWIEVGTMFSETFNKEYVEALQANQPE